MVVVVVVGGGVVAEWSQLRVCFGCVALSGIIRPTLLTVILSINRYRDSAYPGTMNSAVVWTGNLSLLALKLEASCFHMFCS